MSVSYEVSLGHGSRTAADGDALVTGSESGADVLVLLGAHPDIPLDLSGRRAVLVELDQYALAARVADEHNDGRIVGFARWEGGDLVEIVRPDRDSDQAAGLAAEVFGAAGFTTVTCRDRAGRIVDRLIRPQFNRALRAVDEGLATAEDLDTILQLGLGYRRGLYASAIDAGLVRHHVVTSGLHAFYGDRDLLSARVARAAHRREQEADA